MNYPIKVYGIIHKTIREEKSLSEAVYSLRVVSKSCVTAEYFLRKPELRSDNLYVTAFSMRFLFTFITKDSLLACLFVINMYFVLEMFSESCLRLANPLVELSLFGES